MFSCTRTETRLIMEGKCAGIVRRYPKGTCPHSANGELVFTSKFLPWTPDDGKPIPFGKATVVSVRPGTVAQFRKDKRLPITDGFANGEVWFGHLSQFYGGISDDESVCHITFRVNEIDKKAGMQKSG